MGHDFFNVFVDDRGVLAKIFSPAPLDWLDEQVNRVGPRAKSIEHCVSFDFEVCDLAFAATQSPASAGTQQSTGGWGAMGKR